ncbi:hypothetical protein AMATHDRAFT_45857 [Amanita thiersii Skay4041]|uniref:Transmembrane protein n=1 Tax=Amanita thiersii Skay4041 TaxID=703135 RepID=A0A2A9NQY0_9AGAR|nr:hypothetical protein AMATHDRAFT_45857 [Amanita thiersii Skay4041]
MSFVWSIKLPDELMNKLGLSPLLSPRIVVTALFTVAVIYFVAIAITFREYGDTLDKKWSRRLLAWTRDMGDFSTLSQAQTFTDTSRVSEWRYGTNVTRPTSISPTLFQDFESRQSVVLPHPASPVIPRFDTRITPGGPHVIPTTYAVSGDVSRSSASSCEMDPDSPPRRPRSPSVESLSSRLGEDVIATAPTKRWRGRLPRSPPPATPSELSLSGSASERMDNETAPTIPHRPYSPVPRHHRSPSPSRSSRPSPSRSPRRRISPRRSYTYSTASRSSSNDDVPLTVPIAVPSTTFLRTKLIDLRFHDHREYTIPPAIIERGFSLVDCRQLLSELRLAWNGEYEVLRGKYRKKDFLRSPPSGVIRPQDAVSDVLAVWNVRLEEQNNLQAVLCMEYFDVSSDSPAWAVYILDHTPDDRKMIHRLTERFGAVPDGLEKVVIFDPPVMGSTGQLRAGGTTTIARRALGTHVRFKPRVIPARPL